MFDVRQDNFPLLAIWRYCKIIRRQRVTMIRYRRIREESWFDSTRSSDVSGHGKRRVGWKCE